VIFPSVGKGGVIVGGAYGRGEVYEQGQLVGYADVTQATVGAQLGGQTFSELIVFENREAMDRFKRGNFEFAANVSAVALKAGAAAAARYTNGVAVFVKPEGGAMFEASIGGQKFTFQARTEGGGTATTQPSR
jgi:lipid-binding SYLF domain-containing protein